MLVIAEMTVVAGWFEIHYALEGTGMKWGSWGGRERGKWGELRSLFSLRNQVKGGERKFCHLVLINISLCVMSSFSFMFVFFIWPTVLGWKQTSSWALGPPSCGSSFPFFFLELFGSILSDQLVWEQASHTTVDEDTCGECSCCTWC